MVVSLDPVGAEELEFEDDSGVDYSRSPFQAKLLADWIGQCLRHLLLVDLAGVVQIIDIVAEVETIFDHMTRSAMERAVL